MCSDTADKTPVCYTKDIRKFSCAFIFHGKVYDRGIKERKCNQKACERVSGKEYKNENN